ncbi:hypothetical protein PM082_015881 [Marasmius tenuissimus]|nr:hypothetical protein PM082_015881 [Marasmius tenuissimus]
MKKGAVDVVVDGVKLRHSLLSSIRFNGVEESDRYENYDVLETISHRRSAFVYKAKSIRGRLKGRLVALKKLGSHNANTTEALHQGLYHLNIVSLFSTFSGHQHRYHILELCSGGSLSDMLDSCDTPTLPEHELLSIARPLIDALSYLKREGIVHRNVNPHSVLFTADRRIKLSNFTHAIRLPSQDTAIDYFIEHPHYSSPELLSREHCDCASDLWSLGVLIFRCHCGELPFQASATRDVVENILRCRFTIPHQHHTFSDLITSLLTIDPSRRPDVHTLLSSPPFLSEPKLLQATAKLRSKPRQLPYRMPPSETRARAPFREIQQNVDLRRILSEEISAESLKPLERRAASDPYPHPKRAKPLQPGKLAPLTAPPRGLFNVPSSSESLGAATRQRQSEDELEFTSDETQSDSESDTTILPIGTVRPTAFSTTLLSPRVHKTVNGQITILPSRSALVDFREGERRRGRRGVEVFVVSPTGHEVKIYDAPDLNTAPSCVDPNCESKETYELENLPGRFWKLYNDAGVLVARIKQRTPRMVLYGDHVQSSLMGNGPRGDIELLFTGMNSSSRSSTSSKKTAKEDYGDTPTRRLRYSRQSRTLEVSSVKGKGKEWKTKTYHVPSDSDSDAFEISGLTDEEEDAVQLLQRFLRICREVEAGDVVQAPNKDFKFTPSETLTGSGSTRTIGIGKPLSLSLSTIDLVRRPVKFSSSVTTTTTGKYQDKDARLSTFDHTTRKALDQDQDVTPSWARDSSLGLEGGLAVQSRFIPGVGWCIRHNSRVSQGGRYKIMFLDGAVLDVDADEEWAELVGRDGVRDRRTIRQCHLDRVLGERMKVFHEFVSLYDEGGDT